MYDPRLLQEKYHEVEHGKARISAIKAAIQEADENNDVLYSVMFRLELCNEYYQISLDDCLNFLEDFKKRSISAGYNLKPYYKYLYLLYEKIDTEYADKCFLEFMKLTGDENGDCAACDRNIEINYYLNRNNI